MSANSPSIQLAVLIDAENTSHQIADGLFDEIAQLGEATVRRIYGDFTSPHLKGWSAILAKHAITPFQQFAYTKDKNASDITMVIDAMDLLHSARVNGFCLVSSDSDFTRLASRIREQGMDVFGFGTMQTSESLRQACKRFIYTENLIAAPQAPDKSSEAVPILRKAIEQIAGDDGWAHLGALGQLLSKQSPDFDPRTFGHKKLSSLCAAIGAFETRKDGLAVYVRIKAPSRGKAKA
jgi:uncharacterized LabA/DUF88 family protein